MDIDISSLPSVDLIDRLRAPGGCALYFILDSNGALLYIGSTTSLSTRLGCHRIVRESPDNGAAKVAWLSFDWRDWRTANQLEHELIFKLQPALNIRGKKWQLPPRRYP